MKENLKIRVNDENRQEVIDLLGKLGKSFCWDVKTRWREIEAIFAYKKQDLEWDSDLGYNYFKGHSNKEITLTELRELARPKEYLNSEFELVVTNQPLDGYRKIPDNANIFCLAKDGYSFFWVNGNQHYDDGRFCDSSMHNFSQWCEIHLKKILWQRENKVGKSKGRFLHQEWYEAFGRGEELEFKSPNYTDCFILLNPAIKMSIFDDNMATFRLKPKTIQIGARTIVKPISVKPEIGQTYFIVDLMNKLKYRTNVWRGTDLDIYQFNSGLCHLTAVDAITMTDALLELMK